MPRKATTTIHIIIIIIILTKDEEGWPVKQFKTRNISFRWNKHNDHLINASAECGRLVCATNSGRTQKAIRQSHKLKINTKTDKHAHTVSVKFLLVELIASVGFGPTTKVPIDSFHLHYGLHGPPVWKISEGVHDTGHRCKQSIAIRNDVCQTIACVCQWLIGNGPKRVPNGDRFTLHHAKAIGFGFSVMFTVSCRRCSDLVDDGISSWFMLNLQSCNWVALFVVRPEH